MQESGLHEPRLSALLSMDTLEIRLDNNAKLCLTRELLGFRKLSGSHAGSDEIAPFYCLVTLLFFGVGCSGKLCQYSLDTASL